MGIGGAGLVAAWRPERRDRFGRRVPDPYSLVVLPRAPDQRKPEER